MIYSLNEIDALCKKAARGAGFEWGYAEEIGKAIRWLAAYQLPCASVFAAYLSAKSTFPEKHQGPKPEKGNVIQANNHAVLCPVLTGAYLCDRADQTFAGPLQVKSLGFPLLLLPYLAQLAGDSDQGFEFQYDETKLCFAGGKLHHNGNIQTVCHVSDATVFLLDSKSVDGRSRSVIGVNVDKADWEILDRFARRTYVPATEESRLGAGPAE